MGKARSSMFEEFSVKLPLFRVWIVLSAMGVVSGLFIDLSRGFSLAVVLDFAALLVLLGGVAAVFWGKLTFTQAVALSIYCGSANFVVATVTAVISRSSALDLTVYQNLFVLSLIMGVATYLVGKSAAYVLGTCMVGILAAASVLWKVPSVADNLWFVFPAVIGTSFLLYRYRSALDRMIADLRTVIQENKIFRDRERLAALGELSAGIAHEIKNPLNLVVNFAQSSRQLMDDLESSLALVDPTSEDLEERKYLLKELSRNMEDIQTQGLRGVSIIQSMMVQARNDGGAFQEVDMNDLARDALQLAWLSNRASHGTVTIDHRFVPAQGPACIQGNRGALSRALVNLCMNALWSVSERQDREGRDYIPTVSITVAAAPDEVRITVSDNGLGFGPGVMERLFTPYFTTKPPGEGTGLGLKLAREVVVDQHQGKLEVEGDPRNGAQFTVILPVRGPEAGSPGSSKDFS